MTIHWNHKVVTLFGRDAEVREELAAYRKLHTELTEKLRNMGNQIEEAEQLLNLVNMTTDVINGIAINVRIDEDALYVAEIRAVTDPTNMWALVYKQKNSAEVQYGVQLGSHRTLYNRGYTKEEAIEIAKDWVTGKTSNS